ncbi:MAG: YHS domain-containing protein [Cellulosilyticum sp.]|nr:YHS domain-containing protein [Cellulosilyticum sp.]
MVLDFIINIILLMGIIGLFNLTRYLLKIRKIIKMHKDNPNIQGITIVNGEVKIIEKKSDVESIKVEVPKEIDPICGKEIDRAEAYRIVIDGEEYYFCSWECRDDFLKKKQQEGA